MSETFLDPSVTHNNEKMMGTVSSDQIILVIQGGVCLYYKDSP